MSFRTQQDFFLQVAKGDIPGHLGIIIRGHNPNISIAGGETDIAEQGNLTYLTSAETMEIVSTSDEDGGAGGDTGLLTLLIQGVDGTGAAIEEIVTLNGTTDVTTSNSYFRVNSMIGLIVGSTNGNVGSVTATATTSSTIQDEMDALEGISQGSHYTVPLGKRFFLYQVEFNGAKTSGGNQPILEIRGRIRVGGAGNCFLQIFDKRIDTAIADELDVLLPFPTAIIARTDIRLTCTTDQNNTETRSRFYGILVDN